HGGHVVPQTRNIAEISIFTHGSPHGIELGSLGWAGHATVSSRLSPLLAPTVRINLYACSAAQGADSFAEQLTEDLARDSTNAHNADVFGHTTYGNTATLAAGRQFHADAGAGAEASSITNWQLIFDAAFVEEQAQSISSTLVGEGTAEATPEAVAAAIRSDSVGPLWLARQMRNVMIEMPGRAGGTQRMEASFVMGLAPERARDAMRDHWRLPEQGTTQIRNYFHRASRTRHPHHGG
ncbi:MAG TPA: hypothetical protein VHE35_34085, partial [Kofleriaceae bacterium]|nr:hypothetical protein [Kofleriaceae bacterium]